MAYELSKRDPQAKYFSLDIKREVHKYNPVVLMFDNSPYACSGTALEYLLFTYPPFLKSFRDKSLREKYPYKIDYVKPVVVQDLPLVEVKTCIGGSESYSIIKLMRDAWVVNETFSMVKKNDANESWVKRICIYDKNSKNNLPLLKSYTELRGHYVSNGDKKTECMTQKNEYEVTSNVPGPVPLKEFDVKQFLPPEAGDVDIGIATATLSTRRIACLVIGVVLLITGIGLQIWRARRSRNK
ncbi:hypothetical protein FACS1894170_00110 [Planctomycetales bacterium]|nr:hypothetical protein FACS1894170_00110 [Planctomycetales bacterium]